MARKPLYKQTNIIKCDINITISCCEFQETRPLNLELKVNGPSPCFAEKYLTAAAAAAAAGGL